MAAQDSSNPDERATPITTEAQVLQSTPLLELVGGSAGLCKWRLKVVGEPKERKYKYEKNGKDHEGAAFSIVLVSIDPAQYCKGKFTRRGNNPNAKKCFAEAKKIQRWNSVGIIKSSIIHTRKTSLYWIAREGRDRPQPVDVHSSASEHRVCARPAQPC